jgi:hypothetical protein
MSVDIRDPVCVEKWPECASGLYNPRCCRFPKSCSCENHAVLSEETTTVCSTMFCYNRAPISIDLAKPPFCDECKAKKRRQDGPS